MSKYGYGKRRAFQYRLPNAKVEVLRTNLDRGFDALMAQMVGKDPQQDAPGIRNDPDLDFFWAYHDAIIATYGWQLLSIADADAVIKKNFIRCNCRLHDMLGDIMGESNDNPFVDDTMW